MIRLDLRRSRAYDRGAMRGDESSRTSYSSARRSLARSAGCSTAALAGRGSVALVHGPAGIGNSRLLDALGGAGADEGGRRVASQRRRTGDGLIVRDRARAVLAALGDAGGGAFGGAARLAAPVFEGGARAAGSQSRSARCSMGCTGSWQAWRSAVRWRSWSTMPICSMQPRLGSCSTWRGGSVRCPCC